MGTLYARRPLALPTGEKCRLTSLGDGIVALLVAGNRTNLATGKPLTVIADPGWQYSTPGPHGMVFPFRKNASVSTEALPAIGDQSFVTFWAGYPGDIGTRGDTSQMSVLVGASDASNNIIYRKEVNAWGMAGQRLDTWGAVLSWAGNIAVTNEVLLPWKFTALVTIWRKTTVDFYRDGRKVYTALRDTANNRPGSHSLIIGSFVTESYWNSSSDTVMAGRVMGEWTDEQACSWTSDPRRLFKADMVPVFTTSAQPAAVQLAGAAQAQVSASGVLSTAIPLTCAAASRMATAGALSTSISLTALASSPSTSSARLSSASSSLAAVSSSPTNAGAALSTGPRLSTSAVTSAGARVVLSTSVFLAATASSPSSSSSSLSIASSDLAAVSVSPTGAFSDLSTGIRLGALAMAATSSGAVLETAGSMSAVASSPALAQAALSTNIDLVASSLTSAGAIAGFAVTVGTIEAHAISPSSSRAVVITSIALVSAARSASLAAADLLSFVPLIANDSRTYQGMPKVREYVAQERVRKL